MPKGFFFEKIGWGGHWGGKKKWEQEDKPTIGGTIYLETKFWKEMMDKWQEQKSPPPKKKENKTKKKKKRRETKINQIKLNGLQLMAWRERTMCVGKC